MIDSAEELAVYLHAAGVPATHTAISAALRAPRALDVGALMAQGYHDACTRWGKTPARDRGMYEGEDDGTVRPARPARGM